GSGAAGAAVADSLFRLWGLDPAPMRFADGSGLSRYDLVSPELLGGVLSHMRRRPNCEPWDAALPVAGVDGTLADRMREPPLRGNVHAKTGTLSGVRALSGYLTTARGELLAFSILVNHQLRPSAETDAVIEAALREMQR